MTETPMSEDYARRKKIKIRTEREIRLLTLCGFFIIFTVGIVEFLITKYSHFNTFFSHRNFVYSAICILSAFISNFIFSVYILFITYHLSSSRILFLGILFILGEIAFLLFYQNSLGPAPIPLLCARIFCNLLLHHFWKSQVSAERLHLRKAVPPQMFLTSFRAFWTCRNCLGACVLMMFLGHCFAMVVKVDFDLRRISESFFLNGLFYLIFRMIVKNSFAHPRFTPPAA